LAGLEVSLKDKSKEQKRIDIMLIISTLLLATFSMAYFFSQNVLFISTLGGLTLILVFVTLIYFYKTYQDMWGVKPKER